MKLASKSRFEDALLGYSKQYLPDGSLELLEGDEIGSHLLLSGLPHLSASSLLHLSKNDVHHLFYRITPELFLHLEAPKENYNIGILRSISKHISEEIRNKAIISLNQ